MKTNLLAYTRSNLPSYEVKLCGKYIDDLLYEQGIP